MHELEQAIQNNNGKAVILSIHKKWLDKIIAGEKTIEMRKSMPWEIRFPFAVYCYETKKDGGSGTVKAVFVCDSIEDFDCFQYLTSCSLHDEEVSPDLKPILTKSCLSAKELFDYGKSGSKLYGWHITDVRPIDLSLAQLGINRAPQSWAYTYPVFARNK